MKKDEKLIELCQPISKYLWENFDPYLTVEITDERIFLKRTELHALSKEVK